MIDVFLSASVPLPERDRKYFDTANVFLIREAIKALIEVVLPVGRITFGGHPAITPLVSLYARHAEIDRERITIFQSKFFTEMMPVENDDFIDQRYVSAIDGDRNLSIYSMRMNMIQSRQFHAAVVIGGMDGIHEEVELFRKLHPTAKILPVPSTGAAAEIVFRKGDYAKELANDISFASMFRRNLLKTP